MAAARSLVSRAGVPAVGLLAFLSLFIDAGGVVSGQQPPDVPVPTQQKPTFSVEVNLVTTDVIARNDAGQFVADLEKQDFTVLEDGVPQELVSLVLVHGGRVFNRQLPPPPPTPEGIILPAARPTNDSAGRIFILFVDDLHLDFRNTPRIKDLFRKISTNLIHDGDMFGIVSTGPSSLAIDLTYDKKRLDEAIKRISGSGLKPSEIIEGPQGPQGPSELRYRAHVAFSTATEILRNLEKVQNRRKAIIYVSNGYDFNPFMKARLEQDPAYQTQQEDAATDGTSSIQNRGSDPNAFSGDRFADAELAGELGELTRTANRANASFYTIDPRGLVGMPDLDENLDTQEWNEFVRKSQDSLRVIAELTGGIAVVNQNDFDKALKRIDAETSDYYVLGYYSSNPDPTRRTRRLEVKVSRPEVDVWSRTSYSMRRPGDTSKR